MKAGVNPASGRVTQCCKTVRKQARHVTESAKQCERAGRVTGCGKTVLRKARKSNGPQRLLQPPRSAPPPHRLVAPYASSVPHIA
eukprot:3046269-Rhodomonas_salina.1